MKEKIEFLTDDDVGIVGVFTDARDRKGAVLLLHMMPATKESWDAFSAMLAERGLASLAIDLRGHGESVRQGDVTLDYRAFSDEGHRAKKADVEAAARWLEGVRRIGPDRLAVAGASIGANLGLLFAAAHPQVRACLALSAGLDYRGLLAEEGLARMSAGQAVLLAASEEDAYAHASLDELMKTKTSAAVEARRFKDIGHGTTMFTDRPEFMGEAADWLAARFKD